MQKSIKLPKMNQNRLKEIILTPIIFKDPAELNFASNPTMRTTTPVKITIVGRMRRKNNLKGFIKQWQSLQSSARSTIAVFNFYLFEARLLTTWNDNEVSRMQLYDLNEWDQQVRTVCARVIKELSKMAWWGRQVNAANSHQGAVPHENWTRFHLFNHVILRYCKVKRLSSHIVDFHIRRLVSDMGRSSVKVSCLFKQYFVTSRVNTFFLIH